MDILLQNLINGLLIGLVYCLIGVGLTLIFSVMHAINFAHGDFVVLGMYIAIALYRGLGWDPYASLLVAGTAAFFLGWLIQLALLERIVDSPPETSMLVTLGISLIVANVLLLQFGSEPAGVHTAYASQIWKLAGVRISVVLTLAGGATLLIAGILYFFLNHTEQGRAVRAVASDAVGAELVGINTRSIRALSMGVGVALAAMAGVTLIPLLFATPTVSGPLYTLKAFVVVVLGGLGSISGAVAGGLILGVVEVLGSAYFSAGYREAYGLLAFLIILLVKPEGLLVRTAKRV